MKQIITGIISGLLFTTMIFTIMGAAQTKDDSLKTIMNELDTFVQDQLGKDKAAGRFQLQSFRTDPLALYAGHGNGRTLSIGAEQITG